MEVDDDFGDLYSDVLLPAIPSASPEPPSLPPNPNPSSAQSLAPSPPAGGTTSVAAAPAVDDDDWLLGGAAPPAVDPISNWADEDEETDANPSKDEKPRASVSSSGKTVQGMNQTAVTADAADQEEPQTVIPGLGTAAGPMESDDWDDSDSDDDLKIVLNDPEHGAMDDLGYGDGDQEEVAGTNGDQIGALDQDWGEEGTGPGAEGEGKEGDASKVIGGGTGGAGPSRIGYSGHAFHQHHSIYKYVRPGAPVPGGPAGGVAGPQGQLRPPLPTGPYPGRGRGDWRPAGGRMMNGRGYGMSSWGNQMRPVGLDFSLPPQKTIFDFEIDNFEEKPWKHTGAETTDYFNFGFSEESWKDYCRRMSQLKIESTMQSKIRVYESGRSEPEYDPDLPPELAAAAKGHNVISPDNARHNAKDNGQADFNSQASSHIGTRPPLPTGRAIQVEGGYGERLPSIDTRPPRMRDSDSVIEIKLQDPIGDISGADINGQAAEQTDQDSHDDVDIDDSSEPHHSHRSRHRTKSPVHQEERLNRGDSWGRDSYSPSMGDTRREKPTESVEDKHVATEEAAVKDPSVDERSDDHDERLAYTTDTENDEVNFDEPGSPSKNQKDNSLLETTRSDASRGNSRSDKEEEVVQVRRSKPPREGQRASRRSDSRTTETERGRMTNPNNNMRWREGNEMYYHPYMNGRDRDFVPPPHAFRGRSYERFREDGVVHARRFREDEMRVDPRGGKRIPRNFEREEDVRLRKRVEEAEWRGARKRDRDEGFDAHMKRRKEEEAPRRGKVDREDMTERKRERDETNHRVRDKVVVEDQYRSKHREEGSRHREREERQRSKQEETRVAIRTHRNGKEELKLEDKERKMQDKLMNGSSIEKGLARQERGSHDDIDRALGVPEKKHKDSTRRSRGLETGTEPRTKRRRDDHEGRQNDKSDVKGTINELESSKNFLERSEAPPRQHRDHYANPPDDTEDPNSDYDGTNDDSRRGRSKLERWTSHKERDYTAISTSLRAPEAAVPSESNTNTSSSNPKKAIGDEAAGPASSDNRHLDTVERLKRRSERFKLPMPGEKEAAPTRQADNEMTTCEAEVKLERPPRKRRWTGN